MNEQVLIQYLGDRAYYNINFRRDIDNPDQRLSRELEPITTTALTFNATFLEKLLQMGTFLIIIWTISQSITVFMVAYSIVGHLIAAYLVRLQSCSSGDIFKPRSFYWVFVGICATA